MQYSDLNKIIAQSVIDRFYFLSSMLKILYAHLKVEDLYWNAKTFIRLMPD